MAFDNFEKKFEITIIWKLTKLEMFPFKDIRFYPKKIGTKKGYQDWEN